jgi:hypothetical protein
VKIRRRSGRAGLDRNAGPVGPLGPRPAPLAKSVRFARGRQARPRAVSILGLRSFGEMSSAPPLRPSSWDGASEMTAPAPVQGGAPRRVRRTTSETKSAGARLPGEASPAKVAKDGQRNNDDDDDPKPGRHMILSLGDMPTLRRADPCSQTCAGLRCDGNGSRSGERAREPREDAAVHARVRVKLRVRRRVRVRGAVFAAVALACGEPLGRLLLLL